MRRLPAEALSVELTENTLMTDPVRARELVGPCRPGRERREALTC